MKTRHRLSLQFSLACLAATGLVLLTGCQTRSISNSGYRGGAYYGGSLYHGELNEFDVLGVDRDHSITDSDIAKALDTPTRVKLRRGNAILLIQSGAMIPDDPMANELGRFVSVVPFSGVPADLRHGDAKPDQEVRASYAKSLRLAAAKGGCESILCYWGVLESARKDLASKPVSWVPIVGWSLPDERQIMRIRLKVAVIDVRTGNWSVFAPEPFEDKAVSGAYNREVSDQAQVEKLKQKAYEAAAKDLLRIFGN
ncbi:MAG: aminopeptidase [Pedosphaera sp.]|nr:aminopeptidase [Pedosphaera sp.]